MVLEHERNQIEAKIRGLHVGSGTITYTRQSRKKDGAPMWISVIMERLVNADGADVVQAIFTDVTQMHLLQAAQEQEQRIENQCLRCSYLYGVSPDHEHQSYEKHVQLLY